MDDETRAHLDAMEARLMARMNDNQERILERFRSTDTAVAALATGLAAMVELQRSMNSLLSSVVGIQSDLARRVTDIEKKA